MAEWQSGSVDANGVTIHYTRTGGGGPVVVLAHGVTDNGLCWSPLARELEPDYDLIMVDARGHGHVVVASDQAAEEPGLIASQACEVLVDAAGRRRVLVGPRVRQHLHEHEGHQAQQEQGQQHGHMSRPGRSGRHGAGSYRSRTAPDIRVRSQVRSSPRAAASRRMRTRAAARREDLTRLPA